MPTIAEKYRESLAAIRHGKGTPERAAAKEKAWRCYLADKYLEDGDPEIIYWAQRLFAVEYLPVLSAFYRGEIKNDTSYNQQRLRVFRQYAIRLRKFGLLTSVFKNSWATEFVDASLQEERRVLPVPAVPGWTDEDAATLCDPLREFSKKFFRAVHEEYGVPRLAANPDVYGGVDSTRQASERAGL